MLLDGRIFKSGYNSTSTDLIDQAYLRTGTSVFFFLSIFQFVSLAYYYSNSSFIN